MERMGVNPVNDILERMVFLMGNGFTKNLIAPEPIGREGEEFFMISIQQSLSKPQEYKFNVASALTSSCMIAERTFGLYPDETRRILESIRDSFLSLSGYISLPDFVKDATDNKQSIEFVNKLINLLEGITKVEQN